MVARASARADELTPAELLEGAEILTDKVERYRPRWVAVVGVTAYRIGFARPKAAFGPQPEPLAGARLWVLPNPSGLNAHFTPVTLGRRSPSCERRPTYRTVGPPDHPTFDRLGFKEVGRSRRLRCPDFQESELIIRGARGRVGDGRDP